MTDNVISNTYSSIPAALPGCKFFETYAYISIPANQCAIETKNLMYSWLKGACYTLLARSIQKAQGTVMTNASSIQKVYGSYSHRGG